MMKYFKSFLETKPAKVEVVTQPAKFNPQRAQERVARIKATLNKGRVQEKNPQKAARLEAELEYLTEKLKAVKALAAGIDV